ncbi:tetratricopeptide repeat protein [Lentzea sp. NPDC055074]
MDQNPLLAVNKLALHSPPDAPRQLEPPPVVHGRDEERVALLAALERDRLALICGPPGIGKTTLAQHLAHEVAHRFPDGQLCADLAVLGLDDVRSGFALALSENRNNRLPEVLGNRRVLFVLDNVRKDHDLRLFQRSGLIATSRERLGGLKLGPLGTEDSLSLLRSVLGPRVDAEPAAARSFVRLCKGLPLALVVAAKLALLRDEATLTALVDEIPDERREVHSAFEWAYSRLSPAEQRVFRLLGDGFEREFSITALNALAGGNVRQERNALLTLNLLENRPGDRIAMHSLLREYARTLEPREPEALGRLVDHYVSVADTETENAIAAVSVADDEQRLALAAQLVESMSVQVQTAAVSAARARGDRAAEALALAHLGHAYFHRGLLDEAEDCHAEALSIRREPRALSGLGNVYLESGGVEEATALFLEVLSARTSEADEARACLSLGRATGEMRWYERARDICARTGDAERLGRAWNGMGTLHHRAGRYREAVSCYTTALESFVDIYSLLNLGEALEAGGQSPLDCYDTAAEHAFRARDAELLAEAAQLLHTAGFPAQALTRMRQAESLYLAAD